MRSFPVNPVNGALYTVDAGLQYIYVATDQAWVPIRKSVIVNDSEEEPIPEDIHRDIFNVPYVNAFFSVNNITWSYERSYNKLSLIDFNPNVHIGDKDRSEWNTPVVNTSHVLVNNSEWEGGKGVSLIQLTDKLVADRVEDNERGNWNTPITNIGNLTVNNQEWSGHSVTDVAIVDDPSVVIMPDYNQPSITKFTLEI